MATGIITQNVDRLHSQAGASRVVELHGALEEVLCLSCRQIVARDDLQERLNELNPGFLDRAHDLAPDGDADLVDELVDGFRVVECDNCGGVLKPNVVFFGEGVPQTTVDEAWSIFHESDALLVIGSSLAVFSGYRFVRRAVKDDKPIFVINIGVSRADEVAQGVVRGQVGAVLELLTSWFS